MFRDPNPLNLELKPLKTIHTQTCFPRELSAVFDLASYQVITCITQPLTHLNL